MAMVTSGGGGTAARTSRSRSAMGSGVGCGGSLDQGADVKRTREGCDPAGQLPNRDQASGSFRSDSPRQAPAYPIGPTCGLVRERLGLDVATRRDNMA